MVDPWRLNVLLVESAHFVRRTLLTSRRLRGKERRETSITDDLIVRLSTRGKGMVVAADAPGPESRFGADIELWLRGGGLLLGLRLQAKSLAPRKRRLGAYEHLHHTVRRRSRRSGQVTSEPQVKVLIRGTPAHLNAGYIFYNALETRPSVESACCSHNGFARKHGRLGLTYTSAESVEQLNSMNPQPNGIADVLPLSVPLQCLVLCQRWGWWPDSTGPAPMPLRAADLPLGLAGGQLASLVLDPTRGLDDRVQAIIDRFPVEMNEVVRLPDYVLSLLTNGVLGEGAAPSAKRVIVLSEEPLPTRG